MSDDPQGNERPHDIRDLEKKRVAELLNELIDDDDETQAPDAGSKTDEAD